MRPSGSSSKKLIAIAITIVLSACAGSRSSSSPTGAATFKVLVYNVHAGKDAGGKDNLQRVADLVREVNADVVLFQEVDKGTRRSGGVDQPAEYAKRTGYHVAFGRSLDYDGGEYGIAVLSRWPIRRDSAIHLPVDPPQELRIWTARPPGDEAEGGGVDEDVASHARRQPRVGARVHRVGVRMAVRRVFVYCGI